MDLFILYITVSLLSIGGGIILFYAGKHGFGTFFYEELTQQEKMIVKWAMGCTAVAFAILWLRG